MKIELTTDELKEIRDCLILLGEYSTPETTRKIEKACEESELHDMTHKPQRGCIYDTDGDGNCNLHPDGCPAEAIFARQDIERIQREEQELHDATRMDTPDMMCKPGGNETDAEFGKG